MAAVYIVSSISPTTYSTNRDDRLLRVGSSARVTRADPESAWILGRAPTIEVTLDGGCGEHAHELPHGR